MDFAGTIDCHTHLIYAGNRAFEFEQRLSGSLRTDCAKTAVEFARPLRRPGRLPRGTGSAGVAAAGCDDWPGDNHSRTNRAMVSHWKVSLSNCARIESWAECGTFPFPRPFWPLMLSARVRGRTGPLYCGNLPPIFPQIAAESLADAIDAFCEISAFRHRKSACLFQAAKAHGLPSSFMRNSLSKSAWRRLAAGIRRLIRRPSRISG